MQLCGPLDADLRGAKAPPDQIGKRMNMVHIVSIHLGTSMDPRTAGPIATPLQSPSPQPPRCPPFSKNGGTHLQTFSKNGTTTTCFSSKPGSHPPPYDYTSTLLVSPTVSPRERLFHNRTRGERTMLLYTTRIATANTTTHPQNLLSQTTFWLEIPLSFFFPTCSRSRPPRPEGGWVVRGKTSRTHRRRQRRPVLVVGLSENVVRRRQRREYWQPDRSSSKNRRHDRFRNSWSGIVQERDADGRAARPSEFSAGFWKITFSTQESSEQFLLSTSPPLTLLLKQ